MCPRGEAVGDWELSTCSSCLGDELHLARADCTVDDYRGMRQIWLACLRQAVHRCDLQAPPDATAVDSPPPNPQRHSCQQPLPVDTNASGGRGVFFLGLLRLVLWPKCSFLSFKKTPEEAGASVAIIIQKFHIRRQPGHGISTLTWCSSAHHRNPAI